MEHPTKLVASQRLIIIIKAALLVVFANVTHAAQIELDNNAYYPDQHIVLDDRAWINSVGTTLYSDIDGDGFFSGVSLRIDADTGYASFQAYAAIDIIDRNNTSTERLHTTQTFYLYNNSVIDEYFVDIDLIQSYSPERYDLQITLADASNDQIIDRVTARDFSNLQSLTLESQDYEDVYVPVIDRTEEYPNTDIRVVEYAGSSGFMMLAILLGSYAIRRSANRA